MHLGINIHSVTHNRDFLHHYDIAPVIKPELYGGRRRSRGYRYRTSACGGLYAAVRAYTLVFQCLFRSCCPCIASRLFVFRTSHGRWGQLVIPRLLHHVCRRLYGVEYSRIPLGTRCPGGARVACISVCTYDPLFGLACRAVGIGDNFIIPQITVRGGHCRYRVAP